MAIFRRNRRQEIRQPSVDAPARTHRRVAFKISFVIPDFDSHGDLADYQVYKAETRDEAWQWFTNQYRYAGRAVNILIEEGTVEVSRFFMPGANGRPNEWEVDGPWKPCRFGS